METSVFDVNTLLNSVAVFEQALVSSAAKMKANFDAQIAGIAQSLAATFLAVGIVA